MSSECSGGRTADTVGEFTSCCGGRDVSGGVRTGERLQFGLLFLLRDIRELPKAEGSSGHTVLLLLGRTTHGA